MTVPIEARRCAHVATANDDEDHDAIRSIFRSTLALGRPATIGGLELYEEFALDWYLDTRGAAAVHRSGRPGRHPAPDIDGYVLVCVDERRFERDQRRAAVRYLRRVSTRWLAGSLSPASRRFHRLRIEDGWYLYRHAPVRPAPAHVHLNLLPGARSSSAGRALVDWADEVVRSAGHHSWYAEINAPTGRRAAALRRLGAEVVHRAPNRTLTALVGEPVERLTVVRDLG